MKLRVFCLAVAVVFFGIETSAQERAPIRTSDELQLVLDELWQIAVEKKLTGGREKPAILITHEDLRRTPLAIASSDGLEFYDPFFSYDYPAKIAVGRHKAQKFIVAHELGHFLLGHVDWPVLVYGGESLRDMQVRRECEVGVFAVELLQEDSFAVLRAWEFARRQTKKRKTSSILLSPVFTAKDIIFSIKHRQNELMNPFGKYTRRSWIHGPADNRAILVLEGKVANCVCKTNSAAK